MLESLKTNPVRIYAVATAALALVAHYVEDLPTALVLALVAAVLGVGEGVRAKVTPTSRVVLDERTLQEAIESYDDTDFS